MDTFKVENKKINFSYNTQLRVDKLLDCYKASSQCLHHCLSLGGRHLSEEHISALIECEEMCRTTADFLMSDSQFAHELCALCARICDACADSCEEIDGNDIIMQQCINACRACADGCMNMEQ